MKTQLPMRARTVMTTAVLTFRPSDAAADTESYSGERKAFILYFTTVSKNRRVGVCNRMIFDVILI